MNVGTIATLVGLASFGFTAAWWGFGVDDHVVDAEIQLAEDRSSIEALEKYVGQAEARAEAEAEHERRVEKMCKTGEIEDRDFCRKRGYDVPEEEDQ